LLIINYFLAIGSWGAKKTTVLEQQTDVDLGTVFCWGWGASGQLGQPAERYSQSTVLTALSGSIY
jgi:alpha-tubulin suppressor-like RCC1 family protein